jgi:hypothetical protein
MVLATWLLHSIRLAAARFNLGKDPVEVLPIGCLAHTQPIAVKPGRA